MSKKPETKLEKVDRYAGYGIVFLSAFLIIFFVVVVIKNHQGPFL